MAHFVFSIILLVSGMSQLRAEVIFTGGKTIVTGSDNKKILSQYTFITEINRGPKSVTFSNIIFQGKSGKQTQNSSLELQDSGQWVLINSGSDGKMFKTQVKVTLENGLVSGFTGQMKDPDGNTHSIKSQLTDSGYNLNVTVSESSGKTVYYIYSKARNLTKNEFEKLKNGK